MHLLSIFWPSSARGEYGVAGHAAGTDDDKPRSDLNRPWRAIVKRARLTAFAFMTFATHMRALAPVWALGFHNRQASHTQPSTTARSVAITVGAPHRTPSCIVIR
jgi:hypothetical protein